jgi:hypothetical protein
MQVAAVISAVMALGVAILTMTTLRDARPPAEGRDDEPEREGGRRSAEEPATLAA